MLKMIFLFLVTLNLFAAGGGGGAGDTCNNGTLCTTVPFPQCLAPETPGYDTRYETACNGTNWNGAGTLVAPQLPATCTVPPGGGTIDCGPCVASLAAVKGKVNGKTSASVPALPYVKYVRGNYDKLECYLVYDASCGTKKVETSKCKKAGALIPPKSVAPPAGPPQG